MRAMKLPKPTRRDCVAALVGAIVAAALLPHLSPWRIVDASREGVYLVNPWTGSARWIVGEDWYTVDRYAPTTTPAPAPAPTPAVEFWQPPPPPGWFERNAGNLTGAALLLGIACACGVFVVVPLRLVQRARGLPPRGIVAVFVGVFASTLAAFGIAAALSLR